MDTGFKQAQVHYGLGGRMAANLFVNEPESSVGITPAYYDAHMCSFAVFDQHRHCVEEFPKRVGIGGLGGVGNPRQKVSIA